MRHGVSYRNYEDLREHLVSGEFGDYAATCLKIRTKNKGIQPFILNDPQRFLDFTLEEQKAETGKVRAVVLKGRQEGVSTLIEGRFIRFTTTIRGIRAFILTHAQDATENLFEMAERFYDSLPAFMKPALGVSNAKELTFEKLDSGYRVGTAGNKAVGRSQTLQLFHGSEVAFWPNAEEHTKGILQAVPDAPGTEIILESTANGVNNYFHHIWKDAEAGRSEFIAVFIPWFWHDDYQKQLPDQFEPTQEELKLAEQYGLTMEQIYWRRVKIIELNAGEDVSSGEIAFKQEYPMNAAEAFQFSGGDTLITAEMCMAARKREVNGHGPLIVGVDPSYGGDRFAVVYRWGHKITRYKFYTGSDVATFSQRLQICYEILTTVDPEAGKVPDFLCIDAAVGREIADELVAFGFENVRVIDFRSKPQEEKRYSNKRNEIYGRLVSALLDENMPMQIPDSDEFQADLCATPYRYDQYERKVLHLKQVIIKDYGFSPDLADAAALTYGVVFPVQARSKLPQPIKPIGPMSLTNTKLGRRHSAKDKLLSIGDPSTWGLHAHTDRPRRPKPIPAMGKRLDD